MSCILSNKQLTILHASKKKKQLTLQKYIKLGGGGWIFVVLSETEAVPLYLSLYLFHGAPRARARLRSTNKWRSV